MGHPRPALSGTSVPWVSCLDPPVCHRVQDDPEARSQPLLCACWCCWSRDVVRALRSCFVVVHHAHVQLRILTPLLDWKRCSSSQSYSFSVISFVSSAPFVPLAPNFLRVSTRFSAACAPTSRHLVRDLIGLFFLVVGSVAIHLVYADANLFHFEKVEQLWMLSRLSLGNTAIFET